MNQIYCTDVYSGLKVKDVERIEDEAKWLRDLGKGRPSAGKQTFSPLSGPRALILHKQICLLRASTVSCRRHDHKEVPALTNDC